MAVRKIKHSVTDFLHFWVVSAEEVCLFLTKARQLQVNHLEEDA